MAINRLQLTLLAEDPTRQPRLSRAGASPCSLPGLSHDDEFLFARQARQESRARIASRHCIISGCAYNKGMERGSVVGLGFGGISLPPVLTVEEVAELMRIDRKTAYAAIAEGEVPGVRRLGRCIRVSRDVLLRWLAEGEGGKVERRRGRR